MFNNIRSINEHFRVRFDVIIIIENLWYFPGESGMYTIALSMAAIFRVNMFAFCFYDNFDRFVELGQKV